MIIFTSFYKGHGPRSCVKCKKELSERPLKPDPCMGGYLPGIAHACCGHGFTSSAYCCGFEGCKPDQGIMSHGGYNKGYWVKRGKEAIDYMNSLGADIP